MKPDLLQITLFLNKPILVRAPGMSSFFLRQDCHLPCEIPVDVFGNGSSERWIMSGLACSGCQATVLSSTGKWSGIISPLPPGCMQQIAFPSLLVKSLSKLPGVFIGRLKARWFSSGSSVAGR